MSWCFDSTGPLIFASGAGAPAIVVRFGYTIQPEEGAESRFGEDRIVVVENALDHSEQAAFAMFDAHGLQVQWHLLAAALLELFLVNPLT